MVIHERKLTSEQRQREFDELVRLHGAALRRHALRCARDPDEADDLMQESLIDAFRSLHRFRPGSHFVGWVARIISNNQIDRVRRRRAMCGALTEAARRDPDQGIVDPEQDVVDADIPSEYRQALATLHPEQRLTVELCDLGEATYVEAAAWIDCPVGTIRSRLHRAHKALRRILGDLTAPVVESAVAPGSSRRDFLRFGTAAAATAALGPLNPVTADQAIHVWAEGPGSDAPVAELRRWARADRLELHQGLPAQGDVGVLVLSLAQPPARETWAALASALRRGMGVILLGDGPRSLLHALLGPGESDRPGVRRAAAPRVTAPRHPLAAAVSDATVLAPSDDPLPGLAQPPSRVITEAQFEDPEAVAAQCLVWQLGQGRLCWYRPCDARRLDEPARHFLRRSLRWLSGG